MLVAHLRVWVTRPASVPRMTPSVALSKQGHNKLAHLTVGTGDDGGSAIENALVLLSDRRIGLNVLTRSALQRSRVGVLGHHRLLIEQLAGIAVQGQLRFELRNALVSGSQLVSSTLGVPATAPASTRA